MELKNSVWQKKNRHQQKSCGNLIKINNKSNKNNNKINNNENLTTKKISKNQENSVKLSISLHSLNNDDNDVIFPIEGCDMTEHSLGLVNCNSSLSL